jgi:hypothetical protein
MTKSASKSKSPWAQNHDIATDKPLSEQQIEGLKDQWIREETMKFLEFNDHARHHALQDAVKLGKEFPNKMAHISYMIAVASHYDMIEGYIVALASGGISPEEFVVQQTGEDADFIFKVNEQINELTEIELAAASTRDEQEFKPLFNDQMMTAIDIYQSHLEHVEVNDPIGLEISTTAIETLGQRASNIAAHRYNNTKKQSLAHWPMAGKIAEALTQLQSLHMQAAATLHSMDNSGEVTADSAQAYQFTEGVYDFTILLRDNLAHGLGAEIYFYDFRDVQEHFSNIYGDMADEPDTVWELDENLLIQTKITILSDHIIQQLIADNPYDDNPQFALVVAQVAQHVKDMFAQQFPVNDELKPEFVKEHEQIAEEELLQKAGEDDIIASAISSTRKTGRPTP